MKMRQSSHRRAAAAKGLFVAALLCALVACDQQKISELTPGVDGRDQVQAKWGQPEAVWDGAGGEQILEYNRQPAGRRNWQVVLDADGKLLRTEQVLSERNFAQVQPGMPMEAVRKLLGKPAKQIPYELQNEVHWQYKYLGDNGVDEMLFTVVFVPSTMAVKSASGGPDPQGRGGVLRN
jgi:outer membrane protein assembly factor BamE (lipoprotein component of BamABCDE complex)